MQRKKETRTLLDLNKLNIPNHIIIGKVENWKAETPLESHVHPGCFELCCFFSGKQTYAINGRPYVVQGGDCFFTCPDEPHDTYGTVEEKSGFYYIIFELRPGSDFLYMGKQAAAYIYSTFMEARDRIFHDGEKLKGIFDQIMMTVAEKNPCCRARIISLLTELFYQVVKFLRNERQNQYEIPPNMKDIISVIESNPETSMLVEEMADRCGVSVTHFKQVFKSVKGMSPHDFRMRKRIEIAEQAIGKGSSIMEIAFQLGFSSSQHFATVFKKYKGITPTQYKKTIKS